MMNKSHIVAPSNKQSIIPNRSMNQHMIHTGYKRNELTHQAMHMKKNGNLTLRGKQLIWDGEDNIRVVINTDTISSKKKAENLQKETELILIETKDNPKGYIFSFSGGNIYYISYLDQKADVRNRFFELLGRKEDEYEEFFNSLPLFEKKKLLHIFNDDFLFYLHDELIYKKNILLKDEFWMFIKRQYSHKITFLNSLQLVQLSSK